ncbi:MAG TPA: site-2 protease family protein [Pyrinomonadaceae bacterium]|nr:site-2 protease family protein [Pyrinomonadaceae bacterium]
MPQDETMDIFYYEHKLPRPTGREYVKHVTLLLITFITATIAGTLYPFGVIPIFPEADPATWAELVQFLAAAPASYLFFIGETAYRIVTEWDLLVRGLSFSLPLLAILFAHEMGHYIACRIYRVYSTLPYFIPTPPMIGPAGTFGAFIKVRSPMPSRKAVFDIGVAGPIAGFLTLIPIAIIGIATAEPVPPAAEQGYSGIIFSDPLFMKLIAAVVGVDLSAVYGNAFYFAAWVGLLVTALNLIPSGQLDGGHAIYAVLGPRVHLWTGRIAFVVMAVLSVLGLVFFNSPSGFLIAILLGVMLRVGHPEPWDTSPLDGKRKIVAMVTLLIFVVCFLPFPIKIV